ncbi:hypothetical protein Q3G72_025514 [Acer saccharum]|nr:hypothetical protein Q3G72_025514 [Acer saccharum]
MCMKEPYTFISLIIPGPKSPGNDIDVYLRPLIDELYELWENGVNTYDVSTGQNFQMKAAVIWTINDFPAYSNLSGWSTKGKLTCPCCAKEIAHRRLVNGSKTCYMDHHRFLHEDHKWRKQRRQFDGKKENKVAPKRPSGDDVFNELESLTPITFGKSAKRKKIVGVETKFNKSERNYDGGQPSSSTLSIFSTPGRLFGKAEQKVLNLDFHNAATLYVLLNCDELASFTREHKDLVSNLGVRNVESLNFTKKGRLTSTCFPWGEVRRGVPYIIQKETELFCSIVTGLILLEKC